MSDNSIQQAAGKTCRICASPDLSEPVSLREMMFGSRESFVYSTCRVCGTMQIDDIPGDLGRHYPANYYSYGAARQLPLHRRILRKALLRSMLGRPGSVPHGTGPLDRLKAKLPFWLAAVPRLGLRSSILDVGSGDGQRLGELAEFGFTNLHGIDPYLPPEVSAGKRTGFTLSRDELADHSARYDLIMMHHSLEHVPDPAAMMRAALGCLQPGGHLLVRVPLRQGEEWREYGHDWVHLDPPRHLYLFTHDGLVGLARKAGFALVASGFDTGGHSYAWSENYRRDVPMFDADGQPVSLSQSFSAQEMAGFGRRALSANARRDAGLGYFVFTPERAVARDTIGR